LNSQLCGGLIEFTVIGRLNTTAHRILYRFFQCRSSL